MLADRYYLFAVVVGYEDNAESDVYVAILTVVAQVCG